MGPSESISRRDAREQALNEAAGLRSADAGRALRLRQRLPRARVPEPAPAVPVSVDDLAPRAGSARRAAGRICSARPRSSPARPPAARCSRTRSPACSTAGAPDAPAVQLRAVHARRDGAFMLRRFYARQMHGQRVLLADDVRNTGKTFERCAELVRQPAGRCSRRSRSAIAWRPSSTRRAELRARRVPGAGELPRGRRARCAGGGADHDVLRG